MYQHVKPFGNLDVTKWWQWKAAGMDGKGDQEPVQCVNHVVVAVVDTGVDYTHPALQGAFWFNPGEAGHICTATSCSDKSTDGIDNDGNGFIDDAGGWDFVHDLRLPYDTHGHGTHIAGIITLATHEGVGSYPGCPDVLVMPLKYYDSSGLGYNNLNNTIKAFHYAVKMGADIINYSGGGAAASPIEKEAIAQAEKAGVLVVSAAGNDGNNADLIPYFPASYKLPNQISVANMGENGKLAHSSNYGLSVDVAAPGMGIISTLPEGKLGTMSGTSQSCGMVSGIAAALTKHLGHRDYKRVKEAILNSALQMNGHPILGHGAANLREAIKYLDSHK